METTVALCTYNRSHLLHDALASLAGQTLDPATWELLVVDNASTDRTREVVESWSARFPRLRYVYESEQGLNHARNRALAEARGDVVAYFDDDAEADPAWLEAIRSAFDETGADAVGGRITATWPDRPPAWLHPEHESYFTHLDLGPERCEIAFPRYPFGVNMAIRRDVARAIGGFAPDLDRSGGRSLISNGDKEFFLRLARAGHRMVYEPRALVHHPVTEDRVSRKWLVRRVLAQGRSDVLVERRAAASTNGAGENGDRNGEILRRAVRSLGRGLAGGKLTVLRRVLAPGEHGGDGLSASQHVMLEAGRSAYHVGVGLQLLRAVRGGEPGSDGRAGGRRQTAMSAPVSSSSSV